MARSMIDVARLGGGFGGKEDQAHAVGLPGRPRRRVRDRPAGPGLAGPERGHADHRQAPPLPGRLPARAGRRGSLPGLRRHALPGRRLHDRPVAAPSWSAPCSTRRTPTRSPTSASGRVSCRTNLPSNTAFRGFGAPQGIFVIEAAIRAAARESRRARRRNCRPATCWSMGTLRTTASGSSTPAAATAGGTPVRQRPPLRPSAPRSTSWNAADPRIPRGLAMMPVCFGIAFTATLLNQAEALVHVYVRRHRCGHHRRGRDGPGGATARSGRWWPARSGSASTRHASRAPTRCGWRTCPRPRPAPVPTSTVRPRARPASRSWLPASGCRRCGSAAHPDRSTSVTAGFAAGGSGTRWRDVGRGRLRAAGAASPRSPTTRPPACTSTSETRTRAGRSRTTCSAPRCWRPRSTCCGARRGSSQGHPRPRLRGQPRRADRPGPDRGRARPGDRLDDDRRRSATTGDGRLLTDTFAAYKIPDLQRHPRDRRAPARRPQPGGPAQQQGRGRAPAGLRARRRSSRSRTRSPAGRPRPRRRS